MALALQNKKEDERWRLETLTVKELRRQAALKDVPLTHIGAAVEKQDLVTLILKAGPVLNHYDISCGVKIHSADSISKLSHVKVKKKKKKRKSSTSSSKSSGSRTSRSRSRGRRKKRSKSRRRSRSRPKKRSRSRGKRKSMSRSPSVQLISAPLAIAAPGAARGTNTQAATSSAASSASHAAAVAARKKRRAEKALALEAGALAITDEVTCTTPASAVPKSRAGPNVAEVGMAAAAKLGFDVLPKRQSQPQEAPAPGLRPSINSVTSTPYGAAMMPGGRVCIAYLCNSKCELGNKCPEAHIIDPDEEMRVRARFKDQECHYGASCTRVGCLFRHPGEQIEDGTFVPEGQQVMLKATPQGMQINYM
eukprot:TRINITY_DN4200_c0_g2_i1.p1 TRINITY_DN4200_c0_g2~~TRINITY_DN4200_c0_g2_i1.p1  ORF type:complete len:365 (+),score=63.02 TRINITY_DN4200_c0_g2_i1:193-1287(+)